MTDIESLENFWSLKRGMLAPEDLDLEKIMCPNGVRGEVTQDDVDRIEQELAIKLPDDYKAFLLAYGFASWFGDTVFGVPPAEGMDVKSYNFSVIDNTRLVKSRDWEALGENIGASIVIGNDQRGGYYLLDPADDTGKSRVRHIEHEEDFQTDQSWESFTDYLEELYDRAN